MNELQQAIMIQALYYGIAMIFPLIAVAFLLRGFFWKFIKVKMSFGKYVMVKIRGVLRDYYAIGWFDGNELIYKADKNTIRLKIDPSKRAIYRSLMINFIDVDDEKHAVCYADYSIVSGYDAKYYDNLYVWALTRPSLIDKKLTYILMAVGLVALLTLGCIYLSFLTYDKVTTVQNMLAAITHPVLNGTVTPGG